MPDLDACIVANAFLVLALTPACDRAAIEREGKKLLGLLELGIGQAATYATPLGTQARTPEMVRQAMADLRDPRTRVMHELWFDVAEEAERCKGKGQEVLPISLAWRGARRILGWGR
ncbi:MAG: hypothetical protein EB084_02455 [Proteobacteria bacterium]|nr:hypothetical protein [Pseudomonadota bacterium]